MPLETSTTIGRTTQSIAATAHSGIRQEMNSPSPPISRAQQIYEAFKAFHLANPRVWSLFRHFTFISIARGRKHYACNAVFERIRWHVDIDTVGDDIKLNNNYRAYYARMFAAKYPQHGDFFRNRKLVSEDKPAYADDIQVWKFDAPNGEEILMQELQNL